MQEQELKEFFEMMIEKMESMQEEIRVLNEKQNKEDGKGVKDARPTDDGKQIPLSGL